MVDSNKCDYREHYAGFKYKRPKYFDEKSFLHKEIIDWSSKLEDAVCNIDLFHYSEIGNVTVGMINKGSVLKEEVAVFGVEYKRHGILHHNILYFSLNGKRVVFLFYEYSAGKFLYATSVTVYSESIKSLKIEDALNPKVFNLKKWGKIKKVVSKGDCNFLKKRADDIRNSVMKLDKIPCEYIRESFSHMLDCN